MHKVRENHREAQVTGHHLWEPVVCGEHQIRCLTRCVETTLFVCNIGAHSFSLLPPRHSLVQLHQLEHLRFHCLLAGLINLGQVPEALPPGVKESCNDESWMDPNLAVVGATSN